MPPVSGSTDTVDVRRFVRLALHLRPHRLDGLALRLRLDRRLDLQALGDERVLVDAERPELVAHRAVDVPAVVVGDAAGDATGRHRDGELRRGALRGRQPALGDHAVHDVVPAAQRVVGVLRGVPLRRRLDDAREQGPFGRGERLDRPAEVRLRRRLDAVRAATEVDAVQVVAQDLVLRTLLGDLQGDDQLLVLAHQRVLVAHHRVLDVLLGDRRPAAGAAGEVLPDGAAEAGDVEAAVRVEGAVLGREHREAHRGRHLLEADLLAVALLARGDPREDRAVGERDGVELALHRVVGVGHRDEQPADEQREHRGGDHRGHARVGAATDAAPPQGGGRERLGVRSVQVEDDPGPHAAAERHDLVAVGQADHPGGDDGQDRGDRQRDAAAGDAGAVTLGGPRAAPGAPVRGGAGARAVRRAT